MKKAYFLKGKAFLFQEEFNPALYQLVQNPDPTLGWCEYMGVGPWVGFGTGEPQVLFASETGSTAVPERGPPPPAPLHCPCRCGEDGLSFPCILCAVWSMTCRACLHHLAGCPSQKSAPNHIPSSVPSQGKWGKVPALPSLLPSPPKLCLALPCMWSWFDTRRSSDECLLLELWLCLSGMMQPRKNVKHLS